MFSLIKASLFRSNDLLINYSPPLLLFLHSKKKKAGSIYPLFNHIKKLRSFYSDIYPLTQVNRVRSGHFFFPLPLVRYYYTKTGDVCQLKKLVFSWLFTIAEHEYQQITGKQENDQQQRMMRVIGKTSFFVKIK